MGDDASTLIAAALATLFDLLFGFVILVLMMVYFGVAPTLQTRAPASTSSEPFSELMNR